MEGVQYDVLARTHITSTEAGDVGVLARTKQCSFLSAPYGAPPSLIFHSLLCHCRLRDIAGEDAHVPVWMLVVCVKIEE